MTSRPATPAPSPVTRRLGLAAILIGITGSVLMQTMLATAMPRVVVELGDKHLYGWVFAAYLLASTVPLPVFAQLADHHGRRPMFLIGMAGYAVGTAAAALAGSMQLLVVARVVQGVGAAALVPAALAGIADLAGGPARGRLFGLIGVIQVVGNIAGPLVGGWFTDGPGWRWGLWAVVPVSLAAIGCAALGLPRPSGSGWSDAWHQMDYAEPVRTLQHNAEARRISVGAFLLGVTLMSATAYLPLLVQGVFGLPASGSSAVLIPLMVGVGVGSMLGGKLSAGRGRVGLVAAWATAAIAFGVVAITAGGTGGLWLAGLASAFAGVGIGTVQPILLVDAQDDAAHGAAASASSMVQLSRNLGGAVGTSVFGLLVTGASLATGLAWVFAILAVMAGLGVVNHRVQ